MSTHHRRHASPNFNHGLDGVYKLQRSADDRSLGDFLLPAPGAPEPLNGYFHVGRAGMSGTPGKKSGCGCGCKGAPGGCGGGGHSHPHGVGDVSEGARIAYGAGALIALLFGTRASGVLKYASFGAAAYMAYLSYEG